MSARRLVAVAAALGLGALLLQFHIRETVTTAVAYDDAFFASVAKNIALGFGYSTSYHTIDLFDPEISTGPVILLPAALFVRVFGNQPWVPGLVITLAIWFTIYLYLWRLGKDLGQPRVPSAAVLFGALTMFGAYEFGLLGDIPASLLVMTSLAMLAREPKSGGAVFAAGIVLGLATLAKLFAAFALAGALAACAITALRRMNRQSIGEFATTAGRYVAGWLVPQAAFAVYQLFAVSGDMSAWIAVQSREWGFLAGNESLSGVGQISGASAFVGGLGANAAKNFGMLSEFFGSWVRLLPLVIAVIALAALVVRAQVAPAVRRAIWLLTAAILVHLGWWFFISPTGWFRHLMPALIYAAGLAGILISTGHAARVRATLPAAVACLATVVWILPAWYPQAYAFPHVISWGFRRDARLEALLKTEAVVRPLAKDPSVILVGCGWWVPRDLEYSLPGVRNFRDCYRLNEQDIAGKRVLLVRNGFFNVERSPLLERYQTSCDRRIIFRQDPYVVSECEGLPK